MPIVGYSNPYIAEYIQNGVGSVSYRNGMRAGRGVSRTLTVESGGTNDFYSDNGASETAGGTFSSGELTLTVADILQMARKTMLGLKEEIMTVGDQEIPVLKYDETMKPPDLGYGDIIKLIVHGETKWRAVVLTKVKFNVPEEAANTQAAEIEWQTEAITARVMRDDTSGHTWCIQAVFDTESQADSFIRHVLSIADPSIETLTVTSSAGSTAGTTSITVEPQLMDGRTYRYKAGTDAALPALYENLTGWTAWDGVSDITASAGDKIVIAEVDAAGLAMAAGIANVTVKGE